MCIMSDVIDNNIVSGALPSSSISALNIGSSDGIINMNQLGSLVSMVNGLNSVATALAGVDMLWFRATPQERSTDVIFQTYTLFDVEDCPISLRAIYTDTSYDESSYVFNAFGIEDQIPLTIEIALATWNTVTNGDGTLPQRGDIVYIPQSNKLLEVTTMSPVKSIASQITGYKLNCSKYKPKRSRLVGNNLQETIDNNTVSFDSLFGDSVDSTIKDLIDDKQTSSFNNTVVDKHKSVTKSRNVNNCGLAKKSMASIITDNVIVDDHIVARGYYDMNTSVDDNIIVNYHNIDDYEVGESRCLSMWVKMLGVNTTYNVSELSMDVDAEKTIYKNAIGTDKVIKVGYKGSGKFEVGDNIQICRNTIVIPGVVLSNDSYGVSKILQVRVKYGVISALDSQISTWVSLNGYTISQSDRVNLLGTETDNMSIYLVANKYIEYNLGSSSTILQLSNILSMDNWYGFIVNMGSEFNVSVFDSSGDLTKIDEVSIKKTHSSGSYKYLLRGSNSYCTNIRLYDIANREIDKQLMDLVTYITKNDSKLIINDSVETPLNTPYIGQQR